MIDLVISLASQFWPYIAGAFGVVLVYFKGRSDSNTKHKVKDQERALDKHKAIDQAIRDSDGDTRPLDDRLREHGRLRD